MIARHIVVMDALENVSTGESCVESELFQPDDVFLSERSRVSFELQDRQDEDVHDHDDVCQLA